MLAPSKKVREIVGAPEIGWSAAEPASDHHQDEAGGEAGADVAMANRPDGRRENTETER